MKLMLFLLIAFGLCIPAWSQVAPPERPKVGLILSGGGAKGISHIGALKVIEESGLKIDYIGGTSMGSIVAGLYAIGYSADSLEKISTEIKWDKLLSDNIPRQELSIEEKTDHDRYFVSFPLKERKVKLPAGMITGMNIENLLSQLCAHVSDKRDFNDLDIPYLCIAIDILTGKEVVFKEGYLPDAMRASMSIQSIFEPLERDGKLLVDGGLLNNFPVANVRDMGADILIGVDVGFKNTDKNEISDLLKVINQTVYIVGAEKNEQNRKLCDIYIEPDLNGYNASSFHAADTLIARGEKSAREFFPQLKSLADSLNQLEEISYSPPHFEPIDSILIEDIKYHGLQNVSEKLLEGMLRLERNRRYTPEDISDAMEIAFSSLYFEKVTYKLESMENEGSSRATRLNVYIREKSGGQLRVGLNYNSTYKASILLNATFRNLVLNGSRISLNAALGENPQFLASYVKNNGWKPGFGFDLQARYFGVNIYDSQDLNNLLAKYKYSDLAARAYTQSIFRNSYSIGAGFEAERVSLRPDVGDTEFETQSGDFLNLYGFINFDSYDNLFFPGRGTRLKSVYKLVKNTQLAPFHFFRADFETAIGLGKFTIIPNLAAGVSTAGEEASIYHFYLGGLNRESKKGIMPFTGLDFMQKTNRNVAVAGLNLQYNVWKNNYLVLKSNLGNSAWYAADIIENPDFFSGYGMTLGNLSVIGPVEVTIMNSSIRNSWLVFFNIGYWF